MTEDDVLTALLPISILLGVLTAFVATAAAGRTIADLERQQERSITGAPRIQGWVNLRITLTFMAFGVFFVIVNAMLWVGAPELWRMRVNRWGWTLLLASFLLTAVLNWIAERTQVRLSLRELAASREAREVLATEAVTRRVADALADHESYRQIADEAVAGLEEATNRARAAKGEPPLMTLAAVVPEHSSPTTTRQQEIAATATLRARLVAATLALGLPVRGEEKKGQ
jgi:hypothetical protein